MIWRTTIRRFSPPLSRLRLPKLRRNGKLFWISIWLRMISFHTDLDFMMSWNMSKEIQNWPTRGILNLFEQTNRQILLPSCGKCSNKKIKCPISRQKSWIVVFASAAHSEIGLQSLNMFASDLDLVTSFDIGIFRFTNHAKCRNFINTTEFEA